MAGVRLSGVTKVFPGGVAAVDKVDLEVRDRELVVLLGPSGCGKSTLLRLIAGLEEATAGSVEIGGREVSRVPPRDRDVAMVFQNYALYPHMTVFDNMAFGLKLRKMPKEDIRKRVNDAASVLGLEELLQRKPGALSGGQRQRVAVGRAIVRHPKVFLFDEPLSNLDARLRVQMRAEISRLHQKLQATMVYVTHDQTEAMTLGERIAVMRNGRILQFDEPMTLYNRPADKFVAGFIGSPSMNFLEGEIRGGDRLMFACESLGFQLPASYAALLPERRGSGITLGVRPEDIFIADGVESSTDAAIPARVEIVELLGNEQFVHISAGKANLVMRTSVQRKFSPGSELRIRFNPDKIHLFDPAAGMSVRETVAPGISRS